MGTGILAKIFSGGAEKLVAAVGNAFDQNFSNKEEREAQKLQAVQELNRHMEAMMTDATKHLELENKDRERASSMQIAALGQNDVFSKRFLYYFSTFWSIVSAAYLFGITFIDYPEKHNHVVDTVLGFILGTAIAAMFSFFYGTTMNSKVRNDQIYGAVSSQLKEKH
jgi:hypothetical protein